MVPFLLVFQVLTALPSLSFTLSLNLNKVGEVLDRNYEFDLLKDFFKFHVYMNPHPVCALEDELCTLDNNCCHGMECKMAADRVGIKYTCQPRVEDDENSTSSVEDLDDEDVRWSLVPSDDQESENSLLKEVYRSRMDTNKKEEDRLLNDQYYLIKELQRPLTFEEMRELQQVQEVEDYKREKELEDLRQWAKKRKLEEEEKDQKVRELEKIARERVAKVLKEEQQLKLKMYENMVKNLENKRS